ncbi:MAG: hypothetical protein G01um101417_28 [Parcubacteria group bacterium Gr01-1014_17]|nr:MAG: hypothetical protein G01um101417_28 [Parcubacteria group bacterium Gr01-1014_17]
MRKTIFVRKRRISSPVKQKVLLLLQAGVALSFAGTLPRQFRIFEELAKEWKQINRAYLYRIIREFEDEQLVSIEEDEGGTRTVVLLERGKKRALTFHLHKMEIAKPTQWDGIWHAVFFDIPEGWKTARESLRLKLYDLDFYHWQKSVFVHPYPCRDEIDFIATFFNVRYFVRYATLSTISHEAELLRHFELKK